MNKRKSDELQLGKSSPGTFKSPSLIGLTCYKSYLHEIQRECIISKFLASVYIFSKISPKDLPLFFS